ncbi:hypothetical protein HY950_00670 [Candidatus Gottesmanbacteria bacterium]|nr:hypothetical protein [Candidatus Gottesmanbacteria bacterium]
MGSDFFIVLRFWGTLFLVGAAAFPLTKALFGRSMTGSRPVSSDAGWWDGGYFFSKAVGMAVVTWIVYAMGTVQIVPFTHISILFSLGLVFILGLLPNFQFSIFNFQSIFNFKFSKKVFFIIFEEAFFLAALLFWSWIKAHEPSIHGLEKFMDFGFMQSILNSRYFPPPDMWYPPLPINYYYFGHLVTAVLTKLSGIDLVYTFNLMLATIFALTLTMSFSIGKQIGLIGQIRPIGQIVAGLLTAFLVTLAGNMQTIYAFTRGYTGDDVRPFWELAWKVGEVGGVRELWEKIGQGMQTYWYANATRFVPFTIHEFPSYSFVVSDVHGHVLSIPFVLLAIALLIAMSLRGAPSLSRGDAAIPSKRLLRRMNGLAMTNLVFYGFLVGVLLMTNALDGPIYLGLFIGVLVMTNWSNLANWSNWKEMAKTVGLVVVVAGLTSLPFLSHFTSFVTGLAVNCPPAFLANTKIGPLLFEGVEKCQRSPIWMLWILWGFFMYCGAWLIARNVPIRPIQTNPTNRNTQITKIENLLLVFFVFSLVLIIFPEFFYFKDIYPMHFRSNTMFKLGYQAFILFSIVAGYTIVSFLFERHASVHRKFSIFNFQFSMIGKKIFLIFLLPQLFLVSIFPIFSVRSYFNGLKTYQGLDGLTWMQKEYPDDWEAIRWFNQNAKCQMLNAKCENPVLVEADGDSYTDYARFSAFTGIPTIIGWPVHEWLWRGGYDVVAPRREEVRQVYESTDLEATRTILTRFGVRYVIVGTLERQKYPVLQEWKFSRLGSSAFQSGKTTIYQLD